MKGNKADGKSQATTLAVEKKNRKPAAGSNPVSEGDRGIKWILGILLLVSNLRELTQDACSKCYRLTRYGRTVVRSLSKTGMLRYTDGGGVQNQYKEELVRNVTKQIQHSKQPGRPPANIYDKLKQRLSEWDLPTPSKNLFINLIQNTRIKYNSLLDL